MAFNDFGNSFQRTTPVVKNLIIINALVFIAQMLLDGETGKVTMMLALYPFKYAEFQPYQLVTTMFAHGGWGHILFNMFALWSFGTMLERIWGPQKFLIFYIVCGLAASVAHAVLADSPAIGASGAIMGILAAFVYLFPNTELFIFPIPFPVKAKFAIGGFALLDLVGAFNPGASQVAHLAHLGGLIMGFILVIYWNKTNKRTFY